MRNLLFFSRVAFICNLCFVLAWLFKYWPHLPSGQMVSMVLILGLFVGLILNIIVNGVVLIFMLRRKLDWNHFPRWLIIINFLFLLPQLILFLK